LHNYFTDKRPECIERKSRIFYSIKKEWLVIITIIVRTVVLTTKREGLVSQNPRRPDPSQSEKSNNRLGILSFTASFQGGIHRYDFLYTFLRNLAYWPAARVTSNSDSSSSNS